MDSIRIADNAVLPIAVAVFDYDGTCIDGQSGSLIARWLLGRGYLSVGTATALAWWGVRYKLHLPYRQEQARELIFRDLGQRRSAEVERMMAAFHQEVLVPRYRSRALEEIERRRDEGCAVVVASATFDVIAREAARYLGADGYVATRMQRDANGRFTGSVAGDVIAGSAKVRGATSWANERLGAGTWSLEYAYGDHYSDTQLLEAAAHPFAVCPGPTLKKTAQRKGWAILNWKEA